MTPADLRAWRAARGISQMRLAVLLDLSLRTIGKYESGEATIPRTVELATEAIDARLGRA